LASSDLRLEQMADTTVFPVFVLVMGVRGNRHVLAAMLGIEADVGFMVMMRDDRKRQHGHAG
jgi:hypothetical protein